MTGPAGWVLGIDPGAVHTGTVLCRIGASLDRGGVPELEPVDGLTIHRSPDEDPVRVAGQGAYAARVVVEILSLLDLHGVPEDQVALVCIEGYTMPSGWVSHQAMVDSLHLCRVLGFLEASWPDHTLVAPAGTWPGGKTGWDADPEPVPECLTGRRPAAWSQGAGSRGTHQRSTYCMARSGWRKWCASGGSAPAVPAAVSTPAPAPEAPAKPTPVERVVVLVAGEMSLGRLLAAAAQVLPGGTPGAQVELALAAADVVRPGSAGPRLRARLEDLAELAAARPSKQRD